MSDFETEEQILEMALDIEEEYRVNVFVEPVTPPESPSPLDDYVYEECMNPFTIREQMFMSPENEYLKVSVCLTYYIF